MVGKLRLELAPNLNIQLKTVDCSDFVDLFNSNNTGSSFDVNLSLCRFGSKQLPSKHVFRGANACADSLAKHGASTSICLFSCVGPFCTFANCPPSFACPVCQQDYTVL